MRPDRSGGRGVVFFQVFPEAVRDTCDTWTLKSLAMLANGSPAARRWRISWIASGVSLAAGVVFLRPWMAD